MWPTFNIKGLSFHMIQDIESALILQAKDFGGKVDEFGHPILLEEEGTREFFEKMQLLRRTLMHPEQESRDKYKPELGNPIDLLDEDFA